MALATLSIDIVAQIASLREGLDRAGRLSEQTAARIERNFATLRTGAVAVGAALGGAFAGVGVGALIASTIKGVDALNDVSDATGATIENISALEDVALRTGASLETVQGALIKFNKALSDADGKNGVSQALKAIGLDAAELRKLDPAQALLQTAQALARYADDGNKARLVQELFGKSLKEVAPFLNDLAKQGELVATVTSEQAREAEKFSQALSALQKNVVNVARDITGSLLPALNKLLEKQQSQGFLAVLGFDAKFFDTKALAGLATDVTETASRLQKLRNDQKGNIGFFGTPEKVAAEIKQQEQFLAVAKERLNVAKAAFDQKFNSAGAPGRRPRNEGGGGFNPPSVGEIAADGKTVTRRAPRQAGAFVGPEESEALKSALKTIEQVDSAKIAELRAQLEALLSIRKASGGGAVDEAIIKVEEELQKLNPLAKAAADSQQRLNELLADTPSAQLEVTRETMQFLAKAFEDGTISATQYDEAVKSALGSTAETLATTKDIAKDLGLTFSSAFEDAVIEGKKFSDVIKSIGDDITRILLRKTVTEPLANGLGNLLSGLLPGILGSANGNVFGPSGRITAFARGGVVGSPTYFGYGGGTGLMGEAGPEAIVPLKRGADGKLGVAGGGGVVLNQTVNVGQGVSRAEVFNAVRSANAELMAQLRNSRNRDGVFS